MGGYHFYSKSKGGDGLSGVGSTIAENLPFGSKPEPEPTVSEKILGSPWLIGVIAAVPIVCLLPRLYRWLCSKTRSTPTTNAEPECKGSPSRGNGCGECPK